MPKHLPHQEALDRECKSITEKCTSCKLCRRECAFLRQYGSPKTIAENFDPASESKAEMGFECSLCKLCSAVCPFDLDPAAMFLAMRRYAFSKGWGRMKNHAPLLGFEKRGSSPRFTWYSLPRDCDTVLFPGCAMAGSRSGVVKRLFTHLRTRQKNLGLVLDCCTKPSHDLGRHDHFMAMFTDLKNYLLEHGVKKVLVACPSCLAVFTTYGAPLTCSTVYEELHEMGLPQESLAPEIAASFHDSCTARFEESVQASVRHIAKLQGVGLSEMKYHGKKSLCCGEGGGACFIAPNLIQEWKKKRRQEMDGQLVLTYCAGCANFIGAKETAHILDLIFPPKPGSGTKVKAAKAPFTYLYRLLLKRWAKKNIQTKYAFERKKVKGKR